MTLTISRSKLTSYISLALIYAILSILILFKVNPGGGLYGSWDTTRYLVLYCFLSLGYIYWMSKFLKISFSSLFFPGVLSFILFSLIVSLIRLEGNLFTQAFTFKIQRLYFLTFFLAFVYAVFYFAIKSLFSLVHAFKQAVVKIEISTLFSIIYFILLPYFIYETFKGGSSKRYLIILAFFGFCAFCTWLFKNRITRVYLGKVLKLIWEERQFVIIIFLFALAIRVLFAIQLTRNLPPGMMGGPDSLAISQEAKYVMETGDLLGGEDTFLSYKGSVVLFYAAIYKIFGYSPLVARLFNALLCSLSVVMIYYITKFTFNPLAAKITAFLSAGYGYLIQYGIYIGAEPVGLFALELFLLGIIITKQKNGQGGVLWPLVSGMSLTAAIMARPDYYYGLIVILPWVIYVLRGRRTAILNFFVGFMIIAIPWLIRNYLAFGEFTLSSFLIEKFKKLYLYGGLWHYEITKFAEAGVQVSNLPEMLMQFFKNPSLSINVLSPHILKGIYNYWDYNIFFSPAFIFIEPKSSCYNLILCFYLYIFIFVGILISRRRWDFVILLVFFMVFKTVTYVFTTSPTFYENNQYFPLFKDWYRVTMVPFIQVLMGGGIAYLISNTRIVLQKE